MSKGGYHGTASRYIARLYQTVVLRLPYITSEDRGAGSVVLVAPAGPSVFSRSVSPLTSEIDEEEARRRPRQREARRGPTGPVSSRAFLQLILFVGCQPVAATEGPTEGRRMRACDETERASGRSEEDARGGGSRQRQ